MTQNPARHPDGLKYGAWGRGSVGRHYVLSGRHLYLVEVPHVLSGVSPVKSLEETGIRSLGKTETEKGHDADVRNP